MIDRLKKQMSDWKLLVLNIIIIILAIVMVHVLWAVGDEAIYCFANYKNEEKRFIYALESENYDYIVSMYHDNVVNGYGDKKDLQESHSVAKYFEAAFFYKVYVDAGEAERAELQRTAMDEAAGQMGDLAFMAGQIDEKLGLVE